MFVNNLYNEIKDYYDKSFTHYPLISNSKRTNKQTQKGEVDIIGIKGNSLHAYEVKCSNRICKAKKQLKKIRKNINKEFSYIKDIKTFFYCGSSDYLQLIKEENKRK